MLIAFVLAPSGRAIEEGIVIRHRRPPVYRRAPLNGVRWAGERYFLWDPSNPSQKHKFKHVGRKGRVQVPRGGGVTVLVDGYKPLWIERGGPVNLEPMAATNWDLSTVPSDTPCRVRSWRSTRRVQVDAQVEGDSIVLPDPLPSSLDLACGNEGEDFVLTELVSHDGKLHSPPFNGAVVTFELHEFRVSQSKIRFSVECENPQRTVSGTRPYDATHIEVRHLVDASSCTFSARQNGRHETAYFKTAVMVIDATSVATELRVVPDKHLN